jgi:hypothetical protein
MIYEMVVYCGARKVFRILNISTGSVYCMEYETQAEAEAHIEDGQYRNGKIVKLVNIADLRNILNSSELP